MSPWGHSPISGTSREKLSTQRDYLGACYVQKHSFDNMPRTRKVCPMFGKKGLLKLSNHLANVHKLSTQERQPYLIRAKKMPTDI
jgi:hypothetical protein